MSAKKSIENHMRGTLVQVARLYHEGGLSQQEIADRLGVSRSLIAQYLQRAKEAGIVRIQIVDPDDACVDLATSLEKAAGVKQVTVIPNPHGSRELALRAVASAAANFLSESLDDGDTLGLAWGRTTSLVVDSLKLPHAGSIDVLPLMGESGHSGMHSQMNQLVMRAAEHLHATPYFLSLPMVVSSAGLRDALLREAGICEVIDRWNKWVSGWCRRFPAWSFILAKSIYRNWLRPERWVMSVASTMTKRGGSSRADLRTR